VSDIIFFVFSVINLDVFLSIDSWKESQQQVISKLSFFTVISACFLCTGQIILSSSRLIACRSILDSDISLRFNRIKDKSKAINKIKSIIFQFFIHLGLSKMAAFLN
jgi:hypothetical protein